MRAGLWLLILALSAVPAVAADIGALLGRRVTDVRIEADGVPVTDAAALSLIETRIGEPLTMAAVRQTIDHFVTLGRYADIQVFAESDAAGVRLRYQVVPIARLARLRFEGAVGVDESLLRTELADQFGAAPTLARLPDIAQALVTRYQAHGYPAARVVPRTVPDGRLGQLVAVLAITPGSQVTVRRATVDGNAGAETLLQRLGLQVGRPVDRGTLDQRVQDAEDGLRSEGYYEAVVSATVSDAGPGEVDVAVRGDRGDRVQVVFAGDVVPEDRRRSLVPISRLRSVEEEVVEDGSRNLEQYLRLEGYRTATAPAERRRANGVLQITFTIKRGPLYVLGPVVFTGVSGVPRAEVDTLMKLVPGEPLVDARVATVAAAIAEYYRVRGFAAVRVTPRLTFPATDAGARVPVDLHLDVIEGPRTAVTSVGFEGLTALAPAQLLEAMALTTGKPY